MRQIWRRLLGRTPANPATVPVGYGVLLAITPPMLRDGVRAGDAILAVREAVEAVESVGWTSVEFHDEPESSLWLEVLPAPEADPPGTAVLDAIRQRIEAVVRMTLATLSPSIPEAPIDLASDEVAWPETVWEALSPGFSDGVDLFTLPPPGASTGRAEREADIAMLARLLGMVLPPEAVLLVTERAISRFGSFAAVLAAPQSELREIRGFGAHCLAAVKLAHTAAVRLAKARAAEGPVLDNWNQLMAYLAAVLARERIEQFRILFLDDGRRLLADEAQARGTVNHTPVYPREVVRRALELGAASLILVHNHPSGDPSPSRADVEMTAQIQAAAKVLAIEVSDHVIVGNGRWLSFRQEGYL